MFRRIAQPAQLTRALHSSAARRVAAGDKVPAVALFENSPGNEVNLAQETASGKSVVLGVPGAFSPACSATHVPGYLKRFAEFEKKGYTSLYVVAVNDAFVTKAWGDVTNREGKPFVKFLADPKGEFSAEWDALFDASKFFGNSRSKRYAALVEDGKVVEAFVEPDNVSIEVSGAEAVLEKA